MKALLELALGHGKGEFPLETKVAQVHNQLKSGKAVIVFDQATETCNILRGDDPVLNTVED